MLKIGNLHAVVADRPILNGLALEIGAGQVHTIMAPPARATRRAYTRGGRPGYEVSGGSVTSRSPRRPGLDPGQSFSSSGSAEGSTAPDHVWSEELDLLSLEPHERAAAGGSSAHQEKQP